MMFSLLIAARRKLPRDTVCAGAEEEEEADDAAPAAVTCSRRDTASAAEAARRKNVEERLGQGRHIRAIRGRVVGIVEKDGGGTQSEDVEMEETEEAKEAEGFYGEAEPIFA